MLAARESQQIINSLHSYGIVKKKKKTTTKSKAESPKKAEVVDLQSLPPSCSPIDGQEVELDVNNKRPSHSSAERCAQIVRESNIDFNPEAFPDLAKASLNMQDLFLNLNKHEESLIQLMDRSSVLQGHDS